ncbi:von Willebrand factor C and EGF domain-containing protein [Suncus etruscus]|uniref:von Willebrand factor C and EGF domain-containing protein n=1 Tax=Suncus etruscus TaxID=109475 RepID=UPI00210F37EC|nr:von Willebrand factor C and EGF domain-containing protein [Suncus etruscus]
MWAGLFLGAACVVLLQPGSPARGYPARKPVERRRLGPHVCLSGFGSGCCPGWAPSMGSGHCTLPLCSFGCGNGICIAPNLCSCQHGEQGATCPANRACGEYGCDLACNHGGCQEVARVCPVGFSMTETAVGIRCTDIDECLSASCEGLCVNTEGGFVCECGPGMQLSANRHSCQDTDECLGTPCQQRCKNSLGSYRCSCRTGFHLHGNRHSCVDVNECRRPLERRVCHHSCQNTVGSFLCTCRPGYRLRADHVSCEAFPKAMLAPSAILQPPEQSPPMLVLLETGRPPHSPGHSPPSGAPGLPAGVRTTHLPSPTHAPPASLLSTPVASPSGTRMPASHLSEKALHPPSLPGGPAATSLAPAPSVCWHLGTMYESGSRWTQPGCSQCCCEDGKVACEKVTCDTACSHPIPPPDEGCCPSCTGCLHNGILHSEGEVFSPPNENCTLCVCLAGNVSCISPECPPGACQPSPPSECCPCAPVRCYFHGRWYADGAVFSGGGDECTICVCQKGEVECSFTPCPELDCPRQDWRLDPGQCCFTCREPTPKAGCSLDDNGVEFPVGQIWSPGDPCELCICQADGSVSCKRTECLDSCPHPIRIPGQCCPDCSAGCTYAGRVFYNNETFPSALDPCLSCICLLGSVACSHVDCPISCTYPFHPDGACCPVCLDCNYEGRKVANGQVFSSDDEPCTQCTCQLGEVSCERVPCLQACSDPAAPPGDCCSSCPDALFLLSPPEDAAFDKGARTPREDPEPSQNCSSCSGPPAELPPRSAPQLLHLLFRANLSHGQTPPSSLPWKAEITFSGGPRTSKPPQPSSEATTLLPAALGTLGPHPPSHGEPPDTAATVWTLTQPPSTLTGTAALSSTAPRPSQTLRSLLRPPRFSPTTSGPPADLARPTTGTPKDEEEVERPTK